MSTAAAFQLQPLDKKLRGKLEARVKEARDVAEDAARSACYQLGVGRAKPDPHLTDAQKDLRRRLRIHGRQLGDARATNGEQEMHRLVDEIAYEHWHRMLFAKFLAENRLLMYPDSDDPIAVSIEDCEDLAADEGAKNGWELAARFATKMLPQIFRVNSPVFSLTLPPEKQQRLEQLLVNLPQEVFAASDSLGWVYQFWQSKRKDEVNASEVKIGARELPAVTQLFTEPYMVSFLLDNCLGAWWAARRLTKEDLQSAQSEQELRDKAALPGVPLEYLRFVQDEETGSWRPAAGRFDSWPDSLAELRTLDPCCGSGHFLVAALLMLVPMRMELERLSAREAINRVLSENLHGLELDPRCVELAAFALALAAWRFPDAGGYRVLPDLNVACCGLSISVPKEQWRNLAGGNVQLRIALDWLHDEFKNAPTLGSLLNPANSVAAQLVRWQELSPLLENALANEQVAETEELAVAAYGLSRAAALLGSQYSLVVTNVPYLATRKQASSLVGFLEEHHFDARHDLATSMLTRCVDLCRQGGLAAAITPQNWFFLKSYAKFRRNFFDKHRLRIVCQLGEGAFDSSQAAGAFSAMVVVSNSDVIGGNSFAGLDAGENSNYDQKQVVLSSEAPHVVSQDGLLQRKDAPLSFAPLNTLPLLSKYAKSSAGIGTGDSPQFYRGFWEVQKHPPDWEFLQATVDRPNSCGGRSQIVLWEGASGSLYQFAQAVKHLNSAAQCWRRGQEVWQRPGVSINCMRELKCTAYSGDRFDQTVVVISPKDDGNLNAIRLFCEAGAHAEEVRKIDQKVNVTAATMVKVPFDLAYWQQVAAEKYPYGLPEPYSDDPTQWLFHGHPASSEHALQVAVARLLGYRWPAELDAEMELAADARVWVERSSELTPLADGDGIVCIPAVGTEQPADVRLLNLLHKSYEEGRSVEQQFQLKLDAGDTNDPLTVALLQRNWQPSLLGSFNEWLASLLAAADHTGKTLDSWLRDKFFTQHFKRFHHRPFIWHVWDGLKDGFSVLVNYHRLDNKLLETLIYTYLNDWIKTQKNQLGKVDGSQERLDAANALKAKLELILAGESPLDIFVRWKTLDQQPIGWNPDLNDGVRLNIRPWMTVGDVSKKGAGVLRDKPNIEWKKDRGKDVESAPWFTLGPTYGGKVGDRINDHHLTLAEKRTTRKGIPSEVGA